MPPEAASSRSPDGGRKRPGARLLRVAPINNEMVLNYLGERVLGLPRSY